MNVCLGHRNSSYGSLGIRPFRSNFSQFLFIKIIQEQVLNTIGGALRILGFDPGTATTGWACIEQVKPGSKPVLLACGAIRTPAKSPLPGRLNAIHQAVAELIVTYEPKEIAVEELFFAKNRTTAIAVSHARGVILLAAAQSGIPLGEYTPMEVKLAIVGYGNADKKQIQQILPAHVSATEYPTQDDTADAVAIALTHLTNVRSPYAAALR